MKYYIIAGEASGDLHGSNLMKGIYDEDPEADIRFWGGNLMNEVYLQHQSGEGLVSDYNEGAVIGFTQVILHANHFLKKLKNCGEDIIKFHPDVVILIDYPGFNFKVAKFAHQHGFKVFYYIAPKVWASRENRVKMLKSYVDQLFIVFPFEKEYFDRKGVHYIYKGNPLIDAIDNSPAISQTRKEFLDQNKLEDHPFIAILAGSRKAEVSCMMPVCVEFAKRLKSIPRFKEYQFLIAGAPSRSKDDYTRFMAGTEGYMKVLFNQTHGIVKHAQAAVVNSGTASLETCLIGTPQVVAYSGADFNFNVGKHIIKIDFISLGNLILGRKAFKELMQYYFTPENILNEIVRLLEDQEYRENMLSDYAQIRQELGGSGASRSVAHAMLEELGK